jgi:two-component system sensor histidine kinase KdpD
MDGDSSPRSANGHTEHYLVAVSGSSNSDYLIRWTGAMARRLNIPWTALHVRGAGPQGDSASLERNLDLARSLGAEVLSVPDEDVAAAIVRYARIKKASTLVIGKTEAGTVPLIGRRSVMESVLRESGELDLIVLRGKNPVPSRQRSLDFHSWFRSTKGIPVALLVLTAVTLFGLAAMPALGYRGISILYLLAIISLPFACGRVVVLAAAATSALLWNFLFIPPRFTFSIGSLEDVLMFVAFFLAAFVGGGLTSRLKEKEAALSIREKRMALLYGFSRILSRVRGIGQIGKTGSAYVGEHLGVRISIYLKDEAGTLDLAHPLCSVDEADASPDVDASLVQRCFNENQSLQDGEYRLYLPLGAPDASLGVLFVSGIGTPGSDGEASSHGTSRKSISGEGRELLATLGGNLALAIEREILSAENEKHKLAEESARLSRILLNHVSHELRTPLTTIKGAASGLLDDDAAEDPQLRKALLSETLTAADKLNSLVEDLLSMSRLETGALRPRLEKTYVEELLGAAQASLGPLAGSRKIVIAPGCHDAELMVDQALMVQVFRNILRNFASYTPDGSSLSIDYLSSEYKLDSGAYPPGHAAPGHAILRFSDDGPGVPRRELQTLFDTFYRGTNSAGRQGCGLGLSISRGIVEAHGGSIRALASAGGGLTLEVVLPMESATSAPTTKAQGGGE